MPLHFTKKLSDMIPKGSLKYMLHHHLGGPQKARPIHNVHASSLTKPEGFCPRYYALHDVLQKKPKDEWLTAADVVTFEMGNDLQDAVAHYFADMGRAIGDWECAACDCLHPFCKRPAKCMSCGCRLFAHKEIRFTSNVSGASCGVDLMIEGGGSKLLPVEIKTIIKDKFTTLLMPLAEHRLRTNLYLRIIAESANPNAKLVQTKQAKILYVSKGGYVADPDLKKWGLSDHFSPFKEFDVIRDDKVTNDLSKRAQVVKDYREQKQGMPCGICPTALSQRAVGCDVKGPCFSGLHPPVYDWKAT